MAKNKISKKKHLGNVPGDGWKIIGVTEEIYDTEWIVFAFSVTVGKWTNLKIIAKKPTQIKANYRSAWNGERFADSRDMRLIREFRPDLEHVVEDVLLR